MKGIELPLDFALFYSDELANLFPVVRSRPLPGFWEWPDGQSEQAWAFIGRCSLGGQHWLWYCRSGPKV